jgi:hypothetical protein
MRLIGRPVATPASSAADEFDESDLVEDAASAN